jgi:ATP-binding protein involved in chromosome partitioning
VRLMSMGFMSPGDKPLIWRGPMLHSVMQQFLRGVDWGGVDYLVIDLPPGTGDVQLSLMQTAPITGSIVVTTPSEVSLQDARKAVMMFRQLRVDILGLVENMSYLVVPETGQRLDPFGQGGGRRTAQEMEIPFLGEIPLDPRIRIGGDTGSPVTLLSEGNGQADSFFQLARNVVERVEDVGARTGPSVEISD